MWKFIAVVSVLFVAVRSQSTAVSRCTAYGGELPINTYIEGCITPRCDLISRQDVVINLVFRAPYTIRNMETLASAYLLFIEVKHDLLENAITCNFLTNTYCPVLAGEVVQYTLRMYIDPLFPVGTLTTIEFRIVDDDKVPFICIRVPVRIVAPITRANATLSQDTNTNVHTINLL